MEKRVVLAIVLCTAISLAYLAFFGPKAPSPQPRSGTPTAIVQGTKGAAPAPAPGAEGAAEPGIPPAPAPAPAPAPLAPPEPDLPEKRITLKEDRRRFDFTSRGGASVVLGELWNCAHHSPGDTSVAGDPGKFTMAPVGKPAALAVGLLGDPASAGLEVANWNFEETPEGLRAWIVRGGLRIEKRIVRGGAYDHKITVTVTNEGGAPGAQRILLVHGPWTPPSDAQIPEDGLVIAAVDETPAHHLAAQVQSDLASAPGTEYHAEKGWRYVATRADFYLGALVPLQPLPLDTTVVPSALLLPGRDASHPVWASASAAFQIPFSVPAASATAEWKFMLYAGPSSREALGSPEYAAIADAFPNRTFLGLSFGPIGRALGWLLKILADMGMGYGLAVCALTVLIRGVLFPLSKKSQISMKLHSMKMARVKPQLDAVKEKWKDNPKKANEETMRIMKQEQLSIVPGGCLLAFLQMPIWISLYATLQTHFEMRHASFLWIDDLTAPDHLVALPWAQNFPVIHGWLNLMPFLMMATWFGSSMMMPLPDDPEQRAQAKIMRYIPLLFGVFMYQTASGLTLYMTLSALWSIGETWLIRKVWISKLEQQAAPYVAKAVPQKRR